MEKIYLLILKGLKAVGAGAACAGLIVSGVGFDFVVAVLIKVFAKNHKLKAEIFNYALAGFALLKAIGAGAACAGLIVLTASTGVLSAALIKAYANNPKLKAEIFNYALLGFALSEAVGLLALMMSCIILFI